MNFPYRFYKKLHFVFCPVFILIFILSTFFPKIVQANIPLPGLDEVIYGPLGTETVEKIFQSDNIPKLVKNYVPQQEDWKWIPHPVIQNEDKIYFHFTAQPKAKKASLIAKFLLSHTDVKGEVTSHTISCTSQDENDATLVQNTGYEFQVDLSESDYIVNTIAKKLSIQICLYKNMNYPKTHSILLKFKASLEPGLLFPGLENPEAKSLILSLSRGWLNTLLETIYHTQAALIQQYLICDQQKQLSTVSN